MKLLGVVQFTSSKRNGSLNYPFRIQYKKKAQRFAFCKFWVFLPSFRTHFWQFYVIKIHTLAYLGTLVKKGYILGGVINFQNLIFLRVIYLSKYALESYCHIVPESVCVI